MTRTSHLSVRIAAAASAVQRAEECRADPTRRAPPPRTPRRSVVLGDPQAPLDHLMNILAEQNLLSATGWLRPTVQVVCVGDYVDYGSGDPEQAGLDGVAFLAWLAAHDPQQAVLLIGNHDIERVCSLAVATPTTMDAARRAADELKALPDRPTRRSFLQDWIGAHPSFPPMVAARDYESWHPEQAPQYRRLLADGRLQMAVVATVAGMDAPALITHAGVTRTWLVTHGLSADPDTIATRLNLDLATAVDVVRASWEAGCLVPLVFRHHAAWEPMQPSSGLLVHRPRSDPRDDRHHNHLGLDEPIFPRSLPVAEFLVPGLVQVVGHTRTNRLPQMVGTWQGCEPPVYSYRQPLALDRIADDGEVLAPLSERLGQPYSSRVVYADVGMSGCPAALVQVVGCELVEVP